MRLLVIADPHIPVPPRCYGGVERIVAMLCDGLVRRGHTVDLMAGPGSRRYGLGHLYVHRAPTQSKTTRAYRKIRFQLQALLASRSADAVVNFGRLDYLWALTGTQIPLVLVFQNPATQADIDWVYRRRKHRLRIIGISTNQMKDLLPSELIDIVHNATDPSRMEFRPQPDVPHYLVFLGRLTQNKGVHLAIEAAQAAGLRLVIAGNVSDSEAGAREYFERKVRPALGSGVEWLGPLDDAGKAKLLGGATALLFPIQWNEPFGIVVSESLACGCPVIGWRNGSVPEVIRHGETGYIVDSVEQMVQAIRHVGSIDRTACRRDAETRFSADVLVEGYLNVFQKLLAA